LDKIQGLEEKVDGFSEELPKNKEKHFPTHS